MTLKVYKVLPPSPSFTQIETLISAHLVHRRQAKQRHIEEAIGTNIVCEKSFTRILNEILFFRRRYA